MLPLLDFTTLVQRFATQARATAGSALNFTVGSVWRALAEATAALGLWMQWLILQVLQETRLSTSTGSQVDTFVADFGMARLPAVGATGKVTFSRATTGITALIPVGVIVKSVDGTQSYAVTTDLTDPNYVVASGGYLLASGAVSITLPVEAITPGSASNAQPGTISVLASAVPAVDTVTNSLALTGGMDAESDDAAKARFSLYMQGLSKATTAAVASAILGVRQGLTYDIAVAVNTAGTSAPGNFVVTVDDGTGSPSTALQNEVYAAVDTVRAVGETFSVRGPSIQTVAISMTVNVAAGYQKAPIQGAIASAVTAHVNGLAIGADLYYVQLARIAWDAAPGIASIVGLTVNGAQADLVVTAPTVLKVGTCAVN